MEILPTIVTMRVNTTGASSACIKSDKASPNWYESVPQPQTKLIALIILSPMLIAQYRFQLLSFRSSRSSTMAQLTIPSTLPDTLDLYASLIDHDLDIECSPPLFS